jgi:HK97 family phage major capsid protein
MSATTVVITDAAKQNARARVVLVARDLKVQEMLDLTKDNGSWNSQVNGEEASKRWNTLSTEVDQMAEQANAIGISDALGEAQRSSTAPPQPQPGTETLGNRHTATTPEDRAKSVREKLDSPEYRSAFVEFCRRGESKMSRSNQDILEGINQEARTYSGLQTPTSGDGGGYTVPIGFQKELEIKMKSYGRMLENCRILNTSTGNTLDWPTMDDTNNSGEFLAEAAPVNQLNPTFGQIQFGANLASSKQVLISVQLLQDSAFDLEGQLTDAFGVRLGRILNNKYTLGNGAGVPKGLVYAIQNDAVPNVVNAVGSNSNDGISGNTEANSIGSDDLDNLISAVDPAYRTNAKFMMNWKTIDFLRKVKDKYGRPLWVASLAVGEPDRIFGYAFDWNADMDTVGAGKYPVLFGDFSKYVIRNVGGVTVVRYNELYMPNHQVGFQAFLRTDGQRLQQAAFSLLYNPLS